jgi:hypothetical protein
MNAIKLFGLVAALSAPALLIGCDHEVSRSSRTEVKPNGQVNSSEKTVTRDANGNVEVKTEKKVVNP